MSQLQARLRADLREALRARDTKKVSVLRLIESALQNEEIAQGTSLVEEAVQRILEREAKRRRDAVALYEQGGRADLAEGERKEIEIIRAYLPAQMDDAELETIVRDVLEEKRAAGTTPALGPLMGEVMSRVRGRADGTRVRAVVSRILSTGSS